MIMEIEEIARLLKLPDPGQHAEIRCLLTDSRSLETPSDTLFFAIKTAGNDGHRYVRGLYERGVRNFVVNSLPDFAAGVSDANFLVVNDTVAALQRIAARNAYFKGEMVSITGSRGKTTLKEWIYQLMEPLTDISRSPRSFNSQIGVPLSMWGISPNARLAIIEAGISRPGEMKRIADCIQPDTVIFTNLLSPHSEGFGSDREKAMEKAILAAGAATRTVIYCADDPLVKEALLAAAPQARHFTWSARGEESAQVSIWRTGEGLGYEFEGEQFFLRVDLDNEADFQNAAHALSFMLHAGTDHATVASRFANLHKIGTRLNVSEGINGCTIIHDQYTSDLSSLRPALDFLMRRRTPAQTTTLVLTDLHHETSDPGMVYAEAARLCRQAGVDRVLGVGPVISRHASLFPESSRFWSDPATFSPSASDFSDEAVLLKDSPEIPLDKAAQSLEARSHETVLEVNLDAMVRNYNYFRRQLPASTGIVCMVKASGYGAGSYEIAKTLQDAGAAYLAVAVLDEGTELRRKGITMPIMVMNPKAANYGVMFANRLEPEIYSAEMLEEVVRQAARNGVRDYPIHIKLDTGMHRMGFSKEELPALMQTLRSTDLVRPKSIFSHLATADCPDMDDYTMLQLNRFEEYTSYMAANYPKPILRHILNSAGILRFPQYHYDMARLGIGLYGANTLPSAMEEPLSVVSTLRTVIIALREYEAGETIGYGRRGILERRSRIATIPIGYADGMNRHFGRGAVSVSVNGKDAPTVGNICMDACMIDVTGIDCHVGDSVEIFGATAPLQRLADKLDTIPYEILTAISPRVKRVYYRE